MIQQGIWRVSRVSGFFRIEVFSRGKWYRVLELLKAEDFNDLLACMVKVGGN